MHDMTAANLRSAMGGESMAHMRYLIWGDKAQRDGLVNVARMFRAISRAEQAHATGHFQVLRQVGGAFDVTSAAGFGLGATSENLAGAIEGETFEIHEMYPAYLAVANDQGEQGAVRSLTYAITAEKVHAQWYTRAKKAVDAGKDVELGPVRICSVCGHTMEGDTPDKCPICGVSGDKYVSFE